MSFLRSLISFQQFLKRVDHVTEEAVLFQLFLKRVGEITEEA
jgi:hemerythrin-like domain-containing protein